MIVADVMTASPVTVDPNVLASAAAARMRERRIRRMPVVSGGMLLGIVTLANVREPEGALAADEGQPCTVADCMRADVVHIRPDASLEEAATRMSREKIGALPVVQDGALVGIITESDIFRAFTTMLGGDRGFLQITVVDTPYSRPKIATLLRNPSLRTVSFHSARPEVLLVFATPRGLPDARPILEEARGLSQLTVTSWHLSEPQEPRPPGG